MAFSWSLAVSSAARRFGVVLGAFAVATSCLAYGNFAHAHFIYAKTTPISPNKQLVQLFFGELAEPGEAFLIGKIAGTKVTQLGSNSKPLVLKEVKNGDAGSLETTIDTKRPSAVEAVCDYGVLNRDGADFLLQYYAKAVDAAADQLQALPQGTAPLQVVARPGKSADDIELLVLWRGHPLPKAELKVSDKDELMRVVNTDAQGIAHAKPHPHDGVVVLARYFEDKSGEREGKKYKQVRHYSTLILNPLLAVAANTKAPIDLASAAAKKARDAHKAAAHAGANPHSSNPHSGNPHAGANPHSGNPHGANPHAKREQSPGDPVATKMLADARANRIVWENFPGFSSDVVIWVDSKKFAGTCKLMPDGDCEVQLPAGPAKDYLEEFLTSAHQHRMPAPPGEEQVVFADNEVGHPYGRLMRLNDKEFNSSYRIKNNVITEVNRSMGPAKFTISTLEIVRNAEGKYLPLAFNITTWGPDKKITTSDTFLTTWAQVGKFDLPKKTLVFSKGNETNGYKMIEFSNHKLLTPSTDQASK